MRQAERKQAGARAVAREYMCSGMSTIYPRPSPKTRNVKQRGAQKMWEE